MKNSATREKIDKACSPNMPKDSTNKRKSPRTSPYLTPMRDPENGFHQPFEDNPFEAYERAA